MVDFEEYPYKTR